MRKHLLLIISFLVGMAIIGCQEDILNSDSNKELGKRKTLSILSFYDGGIGDRIWKDLNENGIQDSDEIGFPNVTVSLYDCDGNWLNMSMQTDSGGYYLFSNLAEGNYKVKMTIPVGWSVSPKDVGSNDSLDSDFDMYGFTDCIYLMAGQTDLTWDGGLYEMAPIMDADTVLLIIDEDGIDNGLNFNSYGGYITPEGPDFFSEWDVNDDMSSETQRYVLRYFENNIGDTLTLMTGQTGDEGWFAPNCIPAKWISSYYYDDNTCLTDSEQQSAIQNYLGFNGMYDIPYQERLDKIPDVRPLRALGLNQLIGKVVIAVVYDSDISINYDHYTFLGVNGNLQGETLGIVAFRVNEVRTLEGFSSSTLPEIQITILDASMFGNSYIGLHNAPIPMSSSIPNDRYAPGSPYGYYSLGN